VTVRDIEIWRDGGTITFTLEASELAGSYRLRTPLAGVPRPAFRDERELESSGEDERHLLAELQSWLAAQTTPTVEARLAELDALAIWHNLPVELQAMTPLHRLRTVIRCLQARAV
jgi:hypothetical protein